MPASPVRNKSAVVAPGAFREVARSSSSRASLISVSTANLLPSYSASRRPSATHSEASTAFRVDSPFRPHLPPPSSGDLGFSSGKTNDGRLTIPRVKASSTKALESRPGQSRVPEDFLRSAGAHPVASGAQQENRARQSGSLNRENEQQPASSLQLENGGELPLQVEGVPKESSAYPSVDRCGEGEEERGGQKPAARASRFFSKFLNQLTSSGAGGERPSDNSKGERSGEVCEAPRQQCEGQDSRNRGSSNSRAKDATRSDSKNEAAGAGRERKDLRAEKEESDAEEAAAVAGTLDRTGDETEEQPPRREHADYDDERKQRAPIRGDHRPRAKGLGTGFRQAEGPATAPTSSLPDAQSSKLHDTLGFPDGRLRSASSGSPRESASAPGEGDSQTTIGGGAGLPMGESDRRRLVDEFDSSCRRSPCRQSDGEGSAVGGLEADADEGAKHTFSGSQRKAFRTPACPLDEQNKDLGIFGRCPSRQAFASPVSLPSNREMVLLCLEVAHHVTFFWRFCRSQSVTSYLTRDTCAPAHGPLP